MRQRDLSGLFSTKEGKANVLEVGNLPWPSRVNLKLASAFSLLPLNLTLIMNALKTMLLLLPLCWGLNLQAQSGLPSVMVTDFTGTQVNTATWDNEGAPVVISFWATWCKPCIKELNTISELYPDWQDETGVRLIAVSIDDARTSMGVRSLVNGLGWEYDIFLDQNNEFKRAMNVVNIPHTFLLDGNMRVVYQHTSYAPGDEETLYEHILELVEAQPE